MKPERMSTAQINRRLKQIEKRQASNQAERESLRKELTDRIRRECDEVDRKDYTGANVAWECYNIDKRITSYARTQCRLSAVATGGGCDYVVRDLVIDGNDVVATLSSQEGSAESPDSLCEPSIVSIYLDTDWQESFMFPFDTAREAMQWMNRLPTHIRTFRSSTTNA